jgi:hypothetical protein
MIELISKFLIPICAALIAFYFGHLNKILGRKNHELSKLNMELSSRNFFYTIQKFMSDKAKDCNAFWEKEGGHVTKSPSGDFWPILDGRGCITEITTTLKLLDIMADEYGIKEDKKALLIKLFWTQLIPAYRNYFKDIVYVQGFTEELKVQIRQIQKIFRPYYVQD